MNFAIHEWSMSLRNNSVPYLQPFSLLSTYLANFLSCHCKYTNEIDLILSIIIITLV